MIRFVCCFLMILAFFSSCGVSSFESSSSEELLRDIMICFQTEDGHLYSRDEKARYPLTDAMLDRMFFGASLEDLRYVESMAVYFSGRFCDHEIVVVELFDMSHRKTIASLLTKRAELKEHATVYAQGNYVFLICTEQNEEILDIIQEKIG